jgi:hypothetical protein
MSSGMLQRVAWEIAQTMETERISETSVSFYQTTRCNMPEDSHFHTRRRENQKYYRRNTAKNAAFLGPI